jgi:sterol desaturase/sphingolipid hydroxylase (fatty acid hydroxylase superfamily)
VLHFLAGVGLRTVVAYMTIGSFICLLAAAELMWPREALIAHRDRVRIIGFLLIYAPVAFLVGALIRLLMSDAGVRPLVVQGGILAALAAALIADFLYYWYHRAQHAIPWLWRIHAIHHSVEQLGAGAGYHHLLEAPLKALFVIVPASLILGSDGGPIFGFLFAAQGFYVHSTTRLNFGRFGWVLSDNRVHRIHHSRSPEHYNKNFGVLTLLWDRLFGTAYLPQPNEWPEVGLDERSEPRTVREWLRLHQPRLHDPNLASFRIERGAGAP